MHGERVIGGDTAGRHEHALGLLDRPPKVDDLRQCRAKRGLHDLGNVDYEP